jgi:hypothetical protein
MDTRLLEEDAVMQICFVTDDVDATAKWFADLIGRKLGPLFMAASSEEAKATYMGNPAKVGCKIRFFRFGNIDVEFLQPGPEKSAWRDVLEAKGPGCHHIAFKTSKMGQRTTYLEGRGHKMVQSGEFDGGGGRYAYFDTMPQLGAMIELLEFDRPLDIDKMARG